MRRAIRAWLSAGVLEGKQLFPTTSGSPQGGVVSPLIANIALHGLETAVVSSYPKAKVVRYADDLVVLKEVVDPQLLHEDQSTVENIKQTVSDWLANVGLQLNESKTRIAHTLNTHEGKVGFDFLGFNIRQHWVGKTHSGKTPGRKPQLLGYKTIIKPSKAAIRRHLLKIKTVIRTHTATPQARLIGRLTPIIIGWTAYYATVTSSEPFSPKWLT